MAPSCSHGETLRVSGGTSLDVAVVVRAVGLRHVHLPHGVAHVVDPVPAGRHALVDAVQALGLLEAGDLVLWGEPTDGYEEKTHSGIRPKRSRWRSVAADNARTLAKFGRPIGLEEERAPLRVAFLL